MKNPFTYKQFLWIFEHDDIFSIDETLFYFEDEDMNSKDHFIGCLRDYDKPYWVGYCDIPNGCNFLTASELFNAPIFEGRSIKDRWDHLVIEEIAGLSLEGWLDIYKEKLDNSLALL